MRKNQGFTLIELLIVIAIIAIIAAIAIPGLLGAQVASNERSASSSMRTIATAQATFRNSDRNNNEVAEYWVNDLIGLNTFLDPTGQPIREIDVSMARADRMYADGTVAAPTPPIGPATPKASYWYSVFANYETAAGNVAYVQTAPSGVADWGGNFTRFAAKSWPNEYGSAGRLLFIISESNTIFKVDLLRVNSGFTMTTPPAEPLTADVYPMNPTDSGNPYGIPFSGLD